MSPLGSMASGKAQDLALIRDLTGYELSLLTAIYSVRPNIGIIYINFEIIKHIFTAVNKA